MPRISVTLPEELVFVLEGAVEVGEYSSQSEVVGEVLSSTFEDENKRVAAAYALFEAGEVDAVDAFELADVADKELRGELADALGIKQDDISSEQETILEAIRSDIEQTNQYLFD